MRRVHAGLALLAASGCAIADGAYLVRGSVRADGSERAPLAGATVSVPGCVHPRNAPGSTVTTGPAGEYELECATSAMCFLLFWCPGLGAPDTTVDFAAKGYRAKSVRLLGKEPDPHVARPRCDFPRPRACHQIDVTLEAEAAPSSRER